MREFQKFLLLSSGSKLLIFVAWGAGICSYDLGRVRFLFISDRKLLRLTLTWGLAGHDKKICCRAQRRVDVPPSDYGQAAFGACANWKRG